MAKPARDEESNAIIYRGANVTELAALFGMERRDVQAKIYGIPQAGERNGVPIWRVKDVAPYLAKLNDADLVARVLRMNHADLPPMLKKEFWTGAIQREKYLAMTGHLWPTDQVIQFASTAFKTLRMQLALLQDNVEREAVFTDEQRAVLKRLVDGAMDESRVQLIDNFEALRPAEAPEEIPAEVARQIETEEDEDELWNVD